MTIPRYFVLKDSQMFGYDNAELLLCRMLEEKNFTRIFPDIMRIVDKSLSGMEYEVIDIDDLRDDVNALKLRREEILSSLNEDKRD